MIGAIIGDIAGSQYEFKRFKSKDFDLFTDKCRTTDDSLMTLAIAEAILEADGDMDKLEQQAINNMVYIGRRYPDAGYGARFYNWFDGEEHEPYNSFGNGAAMRISPVGYAATSLDEVKEMSLRVTRVTHNHVEALKAAECVASAIFLARTSKTKDEIRSYIVDNYYPLDRTLDEIRPTYCFHVDCMESVPEAIEAFMEADSFEETIRNAVSLGGDSDTQACIAASIAEAYYKIPTKIRGGAIMYLDEYMLGILRAFEDKYGRYNLLSDK